MVLREALISVFFDMNSKFDSYVLRVGNVGMRKDLARMWVEN